MRYGIKGKKNQGKRSYIIEVGEWIRPQILLDDLCNLKFFGSESLGQQCNESSSSSSSSNNNRPLQYLPALEKNLLLEFLYTKIELTSS